MRRSEHRYSHNQGVVVTIARFRIPMVMVVGGFMRLSIKNQKLMDDDRLDSSDSIAALSIFWKSSYLLSNVRVDVVDSKYMCFFAQLLFADNHANDNDNDNETTRDCCHLYAVRYRVYEYS
jgi:hypothetical protein